MTSLAKLRSLLNWKWGALIAVLLAISAVSVHPANQSLTLAAAEADD